MVITYAAALRFIPHTIPYERHVNLSMLKAICGLSLLWQTALFIGIWMRYNWARQILSTLFVLSVAVFAGILPLLQLQRGPRNPKEYKQRVAFCALAHLGAAVMLIACKPIRKLTSQAYQ